MTWSVKYGTRELVDRLYGTITTGDPSADMIITDLSTRLNRQADRLEAVLEELAAFKQGNDRRQVQEPEVVFPSKAAFEISELCDLLAMTRSMLYRIINDGRLLTFTGRGFEK